MKAVEVEVGMIVTIGDGTLTWEVMEEPAVYGAERWEGGKPGFWAVALESENTRRRRIERVENLKRFEGKTELPEHCDNHLGVCAECGQMWPCGPSGLVVL